MIGFRFPIVLSFYALLVMAWVLWIIRNKYNDLIWEETEPLVKEKLFRRLDLNRREWKQRLTFISLILCFKFSTKIKIRELVSYY